MHYYQFNIADYRKDTQHLTPMEHYIYRELIDWYYLDETPIPKKTQLVLRRLRLVTENNQDLQNVLDEFFIETDDGWEHGRIDSDIGRYHAKADVARANGSKGGRPKKPTKTQAVNSGLAKETQGKANQEPLTNNHKPITSKDTSVKPQYSDDDYSFAESAYQTLLINNPNLKKPNLEVWSKEVRLMREQDKREYPDMTAVFKWATQDNFWSANILSIKKFRQKYDTLAAQSRRASNGTGGQVRKLGFAERQRAAAEKVFRENGGCEADILGIHEIF